MKKKNDANSTETDVGSTATTAPPAAESAAAATAATSSSGGGGCAELGKLEHEHELQQQQLVEGRRGDDEVCSVEFSS